MFNLLIFSIALSLKGNKVLLFPERGEAEPIGEAEPFLFRVCVISSVASWLTSLSFHISSLFIGFLFSSKGEDETTRAD